MASSTSKELANSLSKNRGKEYKDQLRFISLIVKSFILRELVIYAYVDEITRLKYLSITFR